MNIVWKLIATSAIGATACASASAQASSSPQASDKALATGREVAACVVRGNPAGVQRVLAAPSDTFEGAYSRLDDLRTGCLMSALNRVSWKERTLIVRQMAFTAPVQAGLLAEAWLRRDDKPDLPAIGPRPDYAAGWVSGDPNQRIVDEMANCIAERNPKQVADLIWATPGSSEEMQAVAAIQPLMSPCLASNATLKTSRLGTRVALATALYHRVATAYPSRSAAR